MMRSLCQLRIGALLTARYFRMQLGSNVNLSRDWRLTFGMTSYVQDNCGAVEGGYLGQSFQSHNGRLSLTIYMFMEASQPSVESSQCMPTIHFRWKYDTSVVPKYVSTRSGKSR